MPTDNSLQDCNSLDFQLNALDKTIDRMALESRLLIEAEHLKRIKSKKIIRFYVEVSYKSNDCFEWEMRNAGNNESNDVDTLDGGTQGPFAATATIKVFTRVLSDCTGELKSDPTNFWDVIKRFCIGVNTGMISVDEELENSVMRMNSETSNIINSSMEGIHSTASPTNIVEWTADSSAEAFVAEFSITSSDQLTMFFKPKNPRRTYRLNQNLREILEIFSESKPNIIKAIYKHINERGLMDHTTGEVRRKPDEKIRHGGKEQSKYQTYHIADSSISDHATTTIFDVFGIDSFDFNDIGEILEDFIAPIGYCIVKINEAAMTLNRKDNSCVMYDFEFEDDDVFQMPILYPNDVIALEKKIEGNRIGEKKIDEKIDKLKRYIKNPKSVISRKIILEKDIVGIKTKYYEDLEVQAALYELLTQND